MISLSLFKATAKSSMIIFLVFLAILLMYMSVMISMFNPDDIDVINQLTEAMPQGMMDAFGYGQAATSMITFMALYYYGFIALMFPMIYSIILANRLVASHIDRGSMAYLLATPNTRLKIITTQALFITTSVTVLWVLNSAAGIAISEIMFAGEMDIPAFLTLNLVAIIMTLAISSICFFFACIFNEAKYSLAFGAGVPILFFIINMLRNIGGNYDWLRYLTIYSLFNPHAIVTGEESVLTVSLLFAGIALALYSAGIFIFSRRNLYL
jgi:ABC-2 type transport system permease protein